MDSSRAEVSSLYDIMMSACESIKTDRFETLLAVWLDTNEPDLILQDVNNVLAEYPDKSERELKKIRKEIEKSNKEKIELRKKIQLIIILFILFIFNLYAINNNNWTKVFYCFLVSIAFVLLVTFITKQIKRKEKNYAKRFDTQIIP